MNIIRNTEVGLLLEKKRGKTVLLQALSFRKKTRSW